MESEISAIRDHFRSTRLLKMVREDPSVRRLQMAPTAQDLTRIRASQIPNTFLIRLDLEAVDPSRDEAILNAAADALSDARLVDLSKGYASRIGRAATPRFSSRLERRVLYVGYSLLVILFVIAMEAILLSRRGRSSRASAHSMAAR
jgi:hypothetical protein